MKFDYRKVVQQYVVWMEREKGSGLNFLTRHRNKVLQELKTAASEGDSRVIGQELSYLANWYAGKASCSFPEASHKGGLN
jgi:hypothetical protein